LEKENSFVWQLKNKKPKSQIKKPFSRRVF